MEVIQAVRATLGNRLYTPLDLYNDRSMSSYAQDTYSQQQNKYLWSTSIYLINRSVRALVSYVSNTSSFVHDTIFCAQDIGEIINSSETTACPTNQSKAFISETRTPFTFDAAKRLLREKFDPFF